MLMYCLPLGKVQGIDLFIHWSWFMFALFSFWLGAMIGFVYLALFVIVLLHELGHCFATRHFGYKVYSITLSPLGGVARLEMPNRPTEEIAVALAGPAVNVLCVPFLGCALLFHEFFGLIFFLNLLMLGFNLIPAFPLDGGRVLRAWLSKRWGDTWRATRVAARTGQAICIVFLLLGLFYWNLGLILIAAFIGLQGQAEILIARQKKAVLDNVSESLTILREAKRVIENRNFSA